MPPMGVPKEETTPIAQAEAMAERFLAVARKELSVEKSEQLKEGLEQL